MYLIERHYTVSRSCRKNKIFARQQCLSHLTSQNGGAQRTAAVLMKCKISVRTITCSFSWSFQVDRVETRNIWGESSTCQCHSHFVRRKWCSSQRAARTSADLSSWAAKQCTIFAMLSVLTWRTVTVLAVSSASMAIGEISDRPRRAQWRPKPSSKASSLRTVASLPRNAGTSQLF